MNINVIKIGGKIIEDPALLRTFLQDAARISGPKLLVHGGGRNATQLARRLGVETTMVEGRRVTDTATLEVVVMVYGGLINKQIISKLQSFGCNALGLTGADMNCIVATRRPAEPIDYGWVGDIAEVHTAPLLTLLQQGITPVLAPITHDGQGHLLNTNADTITGRVASALSAAATVNTYYLFEKAGVLSDPADEQSVIPELSEDHYRRLREQGAVAEGMIPKLDNAFRALHAGVKNVYIAHYQAVSQLGTDHFKGTRLCLPPNTSTH